MDSLLVVYKIFVDLFVEGLYLRHINSNNIDFNIDIVLEDTYPVLVIVVFVFFANFKLFFEVEDSALFELEYMVNFVPLLVDKESALIILFRYYFYNLPVIVLIFLYFHFKQLVTVLLMKMQLVYYIVSIRLQP